MEKIDSISEAFSFSGTKLSVCTTLEEYDSFDNKYTKHEHNKLCIEKIVLETRKVDSDKECGYYVGYDFEGNKAFEYLQSSVNVHY